MQANKNSRYYQKKVNQFYQETIPTTASLLEIKNESTSSKTFIPALKEVEGKTFDYITLSSIMEADDIQELLLQLRPYCHAQTKLVIDHYSFLWEPLLWITQKLGLRKKTSLKNWISQHDLNTFLSLAGYEVVKQGRAMLFPIYIPVVSWFFNTIVGNLPFINRLCLIEWTVARPKPKQRDPQNYSVSVIIPCRNEAGNIEPAIRRCPKMGKRTEIIFVEGNSKDNTQEEIKRVIAAYPDIDIKFLVQDGKGKGDAVRKGFAAATGDILMILDADLTVPPEELPKFFEALMNGSGEFINGSRLVYGMENEAMRFLNTIANYCFALGFSWLLSQRIKDTLCGTKVLFKKDYDTIAANRSYFGEFDPFGDFDLIFGAAKQNLKIVDLPVHYKSRTYGSTQIRRFYHGLILLRMSWIGLWKFKFRS